MAGSKMEMQVGISVAGDSQVRRAMRELASAVRDTKKGIEEGGKGGGAFKEEFEGITELAEKLGTLAGGASRELSELGRAMGAIASGAGGLVAAITGAGTALAALAHHGAEAAAAVQEGANRAGTSVESYQGLAFAFEQSGSSAEGMEKALSKISEAQEKAIGSAEEYGQSTEKVREFNERMRESAERTADALRNIDENLGVDLTKSRRDTAEQLYRLQLDTEREVAKHGNRRGEIERDAEFRASMIRRDAQLREREETERAARERARARREQNRREAEELRKYYLEAEKEAERHAKSLDKFSKEGIQLLDATNKARDPVEVFKDVANRIAEIEDPATRSAKAVELFGRRIGPGVAEAAAKGREGLEELINEAQTLGIILSKEEAKTGKEFVESFQKMERVIGAVFNKFGLAIDPAFTRLSDDISEFVSKSIPGIQHFGEVVNRWLLVLIKGLEYFGQGLEKVGELAKPILDGMATEFNTLASVINFAFGTEVSGVDIPAFVLAMGAAIKVVQLMSVAVKGLLLSGGPITLLLKAIAVAVIALAPVIHDNWDDIVKTITDAYHKLAAIFKAIVDGVKGAMSALASLLFGGGGQAPAGEQPEGHARGGMISGGHGGVDDVPARLTAGEFVVNKASTTRNRPLLEAINSGRGFALGGFVDRLSNLMSPEPLGFASGGLVPARASSGSGSGGTPVHLHIGGESFALSGEDHVVGSLKRFAAGRQMSSAGSKPSWYGA